ncbi:glycosyl transferase family protein [Yoonia sp. BS5-3]|uniref:Glycosyl transferase family protein n=1 Tax=Yoonia phaeophyticola TaxID=3137369 RepID=A0ABZ2VAV1_9RHOB
MSLRPFVQIVARGQGRARPLTQDEAFEAMQVMLSGDFDPEALGALLMVMRLRGETADEIAGFTAAMRAHSALEMTADLDWPSYAAGRSRGAPLFLLSALLVAQAGFKICLHGWNSHQQSHASVRDALDPLGIPMDARTAPITYLPVEQIAPNAFSLLKLRDKLGLRSCVNTVLRMWNPTHAAATVQGVFHPSYRGLQAQAARKLDQRALTVIKGGGGEFERNPSKDIQVFGLRDGAHHQAVAGPIIRETRKLHEPENPVDMIALWKGQVHDDFAAATVISTAGLALWTLGAAPGIREADAMAANLWVGRHAERRISA